MMALDALCDTVPPEMVPMIVKKETTKEAWDVSMRVGDDHVKKVIAQQLRQKFDLATFDDGETIEDYALCDRTTSKMRGLSPKIISGDS
jgi:hypothetical protein